MVILGSTSHTALYLLSLKRILSIKFNLKAKAETGCDNAIAAL
jgi:hypothetical protein